MRRLQDVVARERGLSYVGREAELAAVDEWLQSPSPSTFVFSVTGMGGIGKSALLLQAGQRARRRGVVHVWIDGLACGRTPAGFLNYVATVPELSAMVGDESGRPSRDGGSVLPSAFADGCRRWFDRLATLTAGGRRFLWCVDHYEQLEPMDGWLRERFFAQLPAEGHLIMLASRNEPTAWRSDPGWRQRWRAFPLAPLTLREARLYLRKLNVPKERVDELAEAAGGLPLALALAADAVVRRPEAASEAPARSFREVSARLLAEAAGADLEPLLDVLAVVPEADETLFAEVYGAPLARSRLASLLKLSFVQATPSGVRLHDVARWHLSMDLRERAPARFRDIRRRTVASLCRRLESATPKSRVAVASSLLNVCADALPSVTSYARLHGVSQTLSFRTAREEDLSQLLRFARDWVRQPVLFQNAASYETLLRRTVAQYPGFCRVLQNRNGEPLAFIVALLLYEPTVRLVDEVEPGALRRWLSGEYEAVAAAPPDRADTYLAAVVGVRRDDPQFSVPDLTGFLIREGLAHLSGGARAFIGGTYPDLEQRLLELGFVKFAEEAWEEEAAAAGDGGVPLAADGLPLFDRRFLYVLDLRGGHFSRWVLSFLKATEPEGELAGLEQIVAAAAGTDASPARRLRELLASFHDPSAWGQSGLTRSLGLAPQALRRRIHRGLSGEEPLPAPFTDYDRQLLFRTFVQKHGAQHVATVLHVSRATYYRHLQRAVEHLHKALLNEAAQR